MNTASPNQQASRSPSHISIYDLSIRCELCREAFHALRRLPLLLPCFHPFCKECVDLMRTKGHFRCPQCNRAIPSGEDFPVDTSLLVLMDMALCKEGAEPVCQGCAEGRQATTRCRDCAQFLCGVCFSAHQRVKITKDHMVMPLNQAANDPSMFVPPLQKCSRHPDKSMDYFCNYCRTLVCPACALDLHKNCPNVVRLESILEERKKELIGAGAKLDALRIVLGSKMADAETTYQGLDFHLEDGEKRVERVFEDLVEAVSYRRNELLAEIRQMGTNLRMCLDQQLSLLRQQCAGVDTVSDYVSRLLRLSLGPQILLQKPAIDAALSDLAQHNINVHTKAREFKIITDRMSELKTLITNFGRIEAPQEPKDELCLCSRSPGAAPPSAGTRQSGHGDVNLTSLRITCPAFALDQCRCGPGCTLEEDDRSCITNHARMACLQTPRATAFKFPGTCVTHPLPCQTCFWQIRIKIRLTPATPEGCPLAEVGVATEEAMLRAVETVAPCDHFVLAVRLYRKQGSICARAHYRNEMLVHAKLAHNSGKESSEVNIGFLLDCAKKRFIVLDVSTCRVLCECPAEPADTAYVYPFINTMCSLNCGGADVRAMLLTGQNVKMTRNLANAIHSLICSC